MPTEDQQSTNRVPAPTTRQTGWLGRRRPGQPGLRCCWYSVGSCCWYSGGTVLVL